MAHVSLVRPLLSPTDFNGYPLNLLILGSALRQNGHTVSIHDFDLLKEIDRSWADPDDFARRAASHIISARPDYIGVTSMCSNYALALDLAREIKLNDEGIHITFGGPHVSLCPLETLRNYRFVDTAVVGEGEVSYVELIAAVENGTSLREVPGIACRESGSATLTAPRPLLKSLIDSPPPAYGLIDMPSYIACAPGSYFEVYAGSGCPFECSFCSTSIVWQRRYRTTSPARIAEEIAYLFRTFGIERFNLIHDNLTSDKKYIRAIAAEISAKGLPVKWGFSSRVDTIDAPTMEQVARAGCDYIFFGIESGSEAIQRTMRKRLKLARITETLVGCLAQEIRPTTSFILGFPDEEPDDVRSTVRLAFSCAVAGARRSFINLLSAYTGTPVMRSFIDRMEFDRDNTNSTMSAFMADKHFQMVENDRFLFSNYYSLPYKGALKHGDYANLVDLYTILLFRWPYVTDFLLNQAGVDPLELFDRWGCKVAGLNASARNALAIEVEPEDIVPLVLPALTDIALSALAIDRALSALAGSGNGATIYHGKLSPAPAVLGGAFLPDDNASSYLISARNGEVAIRQIEPKLATLLGAQGLKVFSWADRLQERGQQEAIR